MLIYNNEMACTSNTTQIVTFSPGGLTTPSLHWKNSGRCWQCHFVKWLMTAPTHPSSKPPFIRLSFSWNSFMSLNKPEKSSGFGRFQSFLVYPGENHHFLGSVSVVSVGLTATHIVSNEGEIENKTNIHDDFLGVVSQHGPLLGVTTWRLDDSRVALKRNRTYSRDRCIHHWLIFMLFDMSICILEQLYMICI